jgi:AbrB family looped-hinge helix DNA binding protein
METSLDKFGRVIIPKEVRDNLHLRPGEHLSVEVYNDGIYLKQIEEESQIVSEEGLLVLDGSLPYNFEPDDFVAKSRRKRFSELVP